MTIKQETLCFISFKPLDKWLFNDIAIVFSSRKLIELKNANIDNSADERIPTEEQEEPQLNMLVYGFKHYEIEYFVDFSKELIHYLSSLFSQLIPFENVFFLVSDRSTKIESIGNILVLNDLELDSVENSVHSLIYLSLTVSLFYSRIYFGSLVSYAGPEEKFIVEGIRGTLSLIALQTSRVLDSYLSRFSKDKIKLEKIVHNKADTTASEQYEVILDETQELGEEGSMKKSQPGKNKFLNESLLSYNSAEEDKNVETLETNELLNLYLIELKYKLFETELSKHTVPLYDQNQFYMKKQMETINYSNSLAKFKMFYVLKELMVPTHKFISTFKSIVKSYCYETITVQLFIQTITDIIDSDSKQDEQLGDWFRDNFEKAGINKIEYEVIPQKKKTSRIEQFKLIQTDMSVLNKSNQVFRKHNTDIIFLNADLETLYHMDIVIDDQREYVVKELRDKYIPKATIINASENGYFYAKLSEATVDYLASMVPAIKGEIIKLKLFRHLLYSGSHIDYLDFASDVITSDSNHILLESILKNSADLLEANFPSRAYNSFSETVVNEVEEIKLKLREACITRITRPERREKPGIVNILVKYLPHFMCSNIKGARRVFDELRGLAGSKAGESLVREIFSSLFDRYFAFHNVDLSEKHNLVRAVFKNRELARHLNEAELIARCDKICERIRAGSRKEFVFDDIFKTVLKYDRVILSNEDFQFLIDNIHKLCSARIDENLIIEIFPLNCMIAKNSQALRLSNELITDLEEKGMFDYSSIIKEQLEKMEKMMENFVATHQLLAQP